MPLCRSSTSLRVRSSVRGIHQSPPQRRGPRRCAGICVSRKGWAIDQARRTLAQIRRRVDTFASTVQCGTRPARCRVLASQPTSGLRPGSAVVHGVLLRRRVHRQRTASEQISIFLRPECFSTRFLGTSGARYRSGSSWPYYRESSWPSMLFVTGLFFKVDSFTGGGVEREK